MFVEGVLEQFGGNRQIVAQTRDEKEDVQMALHHAAAGEPVNLDRPTNQGFQNGTAAITRTKSFEAVRLVVNEGQSIPSHSVPGEITLFCLEGKVSLGLESGDVQLSKGEWIYLEGRQSHSVTGIRNSVVLLTILFSQT